MFMWIILAALAFGAVFDGLGAVKAIESLFTERLALNPWVILILMQLSFIIMGTFLDDTAMLVIVAPLYVPLVGALGFDLIWYGILYTITTQIAYMTPPFGYNLFLMRAMAPPEVTLRDIYASITPFVLVMVAALAVVMAFPGVALWLPGGGVWAVTDGRRGARVGAMEHAIPTERMTADEFERWLEGRPGDDRFELSDGEVVAMAAERAVHAVVKGAAFAALRDAARDTPCQAFTDGMAVRIDASTQREPDAALRCGPRLPRDAMFYEDPVVLVEVLSPSTSSTDMNAKFSQYAGIDSLVHYLILDPDRRLAIHHRRAEGGFHTALLPGGPLRLDPPGITLDLDAILSETDDT